MPKFKLLTVLFVVFFSSLPKAGEVEVLHWWTSGGEAKSVQTLKDILEQQGHTWRDFAVAGGSGTSAMEVLKTRAVSGNPPAAAQIKGHDIQEWGNLGFLATLDDIAAENSWNTIIPPVIASLVKFENRYVAVPVNVHRINWLWANQDIFRRVGISVPTTIDQFFIAAEKIKKAGYIPLAHGGQPWQDATLFEVVALSVLGSEDYLKAFVDLDMAVLSGRKMAESFRLFKKMKDYIDVNAPGRDWNAATAMVINGAAAMQIMGDWAKGEFSAAGKQAGKDYLCAPAPGTGNQFIHSVDSIVFFQLLDKENQRAQKALAEAMLTPEFQREFNLNKGSVPVTPDADLSAFDHCSKNSMTAFRQSVESKKLLPSMAHGMSTTSYAQGAMYDVISDFFNDPDADPAEAALRLAKAVESSL